MDTSTPVQSEIMRADSDLFAEVMHAHGIKPEQIAMITGVAVGHLRRIMHGQYPPTAITWRALYRLTRDARLVSFLLGDGEYYLYPLPADNGKTLPELLVDQAHANAMLMRHAHARDTGAIDNTIRDAMDNLQRIYSRTRSAPVGGKIDEVA